MPLYIAFLRSINLPDCRIGIKFDKDPSAVEQHSYLTTIVTFALSIN